MTNTASKKSTDSQKVCFFFLDLHLRTSKFRVQQCTLYMVMYTKKEPDDDNSGELDSQRME